VTPRTRHRLSSYASYAWIAAVAAVPSTPARATAQYLDPDRCLTCQDKQEHFAAGAGLDLLARGPWVAESFRDAAWKRVALTTVIATAWEVIELAEARRDGKAGRPGYGFGTLDIAAGIAGAVTVEALTSVARKFVKHRSRRPAT
jgi:hypothetical protein